MVYYEYVITSYSEVLYKWWCIMELNNDESKGHIDTFILAIFVEDD
ncbi:MAG: hypothetical protein E7J33_06040 [Peptostreptococcaceae bacterium]|nr:hypothetical protein [Peptostreptococcaceae bacterium]